MKTKKLTPSQILLVRDYLEKNVPSEKIQAKLKITKQQVAAVKAHMKMGNYEKEFV
jgi:hypothetical protein